MNGYDFLFGVVALIFLAGMHRRWEKHTLVKYLASKGMEGRDIVDVLAAYSDNFDDINKEKE